MASAVDGEHALVKVRAIGWSHNSCVFAPLPSHPAWIRSFHPSGLSKTMQEGVYPLAGGGSGGCFRGAGFAAAHGRGDALALRDCKNPVDGW